MTERGTIGGGAIGPWGAPGVALAPWWLRERLEGQPLPAFLQNNGTATWEQLGPNWAEHFRNLDIERAERVIRIAASDALDFLPDLRNVSLVPEGLTIDVFQFGELELKGRTLNVLRRQGLAADPRRLAELTLADALGWHNFGVVSLLDLSCCLENAFVGEANAVGPDEQANVPDEPSVEPERWTYEIALRDPRLEHLGLPDLSGSLGQALESTRSRKLAEAVPDVQIVLERIEQLALMPAIGDLINAAGDLDDERLDAVVLRLGIAGDKPLTLEEAGERLGLTRERVRQIVRGIEKVFEKIRPVYLPQLDEALAELASIAPASIGEADRHLQQRGYGPVTAQGVVRAAEFFGRPPTITIQQRIVLGPNHPILGSNALRATASKAKSLARSSAASNLDYLAEAMAEEGVVIPETVLGIVVDGISDMTRDGQWFWLERPGHGDKLATVAKKVLAIHQPQSVRSVREALGRRLRFKAIEPVPPQHVVAKILDRHPQFRLVNDQVFSVEEIQVEEAMGDLERAMVTILKSAPGGVMTRPELMEACYDQGLNMHSVTVYTTYSPCLERVGPGVWSARGADIDPARVELARERLGKSAGVVRESGWTPDGNPWFAFELTKSNYAGPVATVDAGLKAILKGRNLPAYTGRGVNAGRIGISDDGASAWGFAKAIEVLGADPGDVIQTEVNLLSGTAVVSLMSADEFD